MDYSDLVKEYKKFILDDPVAATDAGIHEKDWMMPSLTKDKFLRESERAKQILDKLNNIEKNDFDFNDQIDVDLMELSLKKIIFSNELRYNNLFDYEQKPDAGSTIIWALLYLFLKDPRDSEIRIDAINSRIKQMPRFLREYKPTLKSVIERWKIIEAGRLKNVSELFQNISTWATRENYSQIEILKINIKNAEKAISDYLDYLNSLDIAVNFSIGEDQAKELIKLNGIDLTLEEIFNMSKEFFREHNLKIVQLVNKIKKKYFLDADSSCEEVINFVKQKFSISANNVIRQYEKDQKNILAFVKESDLFILPKSDKLIILQTPSYLIPSIPTGAMFPPAQFEEGAKTSVIYLTVGEKDQDSLMITQIMIHEGVPGHHLQFAIAYDNISTVRKLADYKTCTEGWATYLENFMGTIGFIDGNIIDAYTLITLSDFARLGARVAIDLYFMTNNSKYLNVIEGFIPDGENPFQKAKSLLRKATKFTETRAEGELNWYSERRGYPMCYLVGNKLVSQLQKDVLKKFENKEDGLRIFHKTYLNEGIMPINFLRRIFKEKGIL